MTAGRDTDDAIQPALVLTVPHAVFERIMQLYGAGLISKAEARRLLLLDD